jgi:hypothetical protein
MYPFVACQRNCRSERLLRLAAPRETDIMKEGEMERARTHARGGEVWVSGSGRERERVRAHTPSVRERAREIEIARERDGERRGEGATERACARDLSSLFLSRAKERGRVRERAKEKERAC